VTCSRLVSVVIQFDRATDLFLLLVARILHLDLPSTFRRRPVQLPVTSLSLSLCLSIFSMPSSSYVVSLPHNALGCVSIRSIGRFASFLLFFMKFPFSLPPHSFCHNAHISSTYVFSDFFSIAFCISSACTSCRFQNPYSLPSTSTQNSIAYLKPRWPRYDLIFRCHMTL